MNRKGALPDRRADTVTARIAAANYHDVFPLGINRVGPVESGQRVAGHATILLAQRSFMASSTPSKLGFAGHVQPARPRPHPCERQTASNFCQKVLGRNVFAGA